MPSDLSSNPWIARKRNSIWEQHHITRLAPQQPVPPVPPVPPVRGSSRKLHLTASQEHRSSPISIQFFQFRRPEPTISRIAAPRIRNAVVLPAQLSLGTAYSYLCLHAAYTCVRCLTCNASTSALSQSDFLASRFLPLASESSLRYPVACHDRSTSSQRPGPHPTCTGATSFVRRFCEPCTIRDALPSRNTSPTLDTRPAAF